MVGTLLGLVWRIFLEVLTLKARNSKRPCKQMHRLSEENLEKSQRGKNTWDKKRTKLSLSLDLKKEDLTLSEWERLSADLESEEE